MSREIELAYPNDPRGWLRRSVEDYYKIRWPIQAALVVSFAALLVLVGWPLLSRVGHALAAVWGIDPEVSVRGQSHAAEWLAAFILAIIVVWSIVTMVWVGVVITWLVTVRDWSLRDASNALLRCRYPRHWIRPGAA